MDAEGSVYMQQAVALDKLFPGQQREPHRQFINDLRDLIQSKVEDGHNILIAGDFNQDVQDNNLPLISMLRQFGLRELIEKKHAGCRLPPTFDDGSEPIDGIFGSENFIPIRAGYKKFHRNYFSNHRSYWIDLPISQILGEGGEAVIRPKGRRLQTKIPKIRDKYLKVLKAEIRKRKLLKKLEKLYEKAKKHRRLNADELRELGKLHQEQRRCLAIAERNCTKLRTGDVEHSRELGQAMGDIACWKLIIRREERKGKRNRPHASLVRRVTKSWNFHENWKDLSLGEMKAALNKAIEDYRRIKPSAPDKREEFHCELAHDRAMEDGLKFESHLKQIKNQEASGRMWKRIKNATKKSAGGAAPYVEIVNDDGSRTRITEKRQMEERIAIANQAKLQQANNIHWRQEPLQSHFGEQGDVDKWEKIFRGELKLPEGYEAEKGLRLFLDKITKDQIPEVDCVPNDEEYNASWKKMREKTSSCPPTHFGHYRAPDPDTPESKINTILGTIAMYTGEIPELWKECVNTMLIKKINDMQAEKLRLVTLLEPQYLHLTKLVNKVMVQNGEDHGILADEQYGSRKRKNSRMQCLHKRLIYDLTRVKHSNLVLIANDLKSNYDRILMVIAFLALRRCGIDEQTAKVVTKTMMEMKHRIRTKYGDSDFYYGGDKWEDGILPHGNGQGNGDGPGLWLVISSICFLIMADEGFGVEMDSAISRTLMFLVALAFVDDTDLIEEALCVADVMEQAQASLTLWEQLMRATGGALEPSKSDWVIVSYKEENGKWKLRPKNDELVLRVRDPYNEVKSLNQLDPKDARETLGIWLSPTGDETIQHTKLLEAINKWCTGMQSRFLPSRDVEIAIRSTIGRKIHYCLVATDFSKTQCKDLINPVIRRVMPKMVLPRNMARTVVHGPISFLGVGIDDPYYVQLVERVKIILDCGGHNNHTGRILTNLIEEHILECGMPGQITTWNLDLVQHLMTYSWMKSTLIQMADSRIKIHSNHAELKLWRTNDSFIMVRAFHRTRGAGGLDLQQISSINKCRKYMNVTTLSDITDGSGHYIRKSAYRCSRSLNSTSSKAYKWPKQLRPTEYDIIQWTSFLDSLTIDQRKLSVRLGSWNTEAANIQKWRYDESSKVLYCLHGNSVSSWQPYGIRSSRRPIFRQSHDTTSSMPSNATLLPVIKHRRDGSVAILGYSTIEQPINQSLTFDEEISTYGWIIADLQINNAARIKANIEKGTAQIATDGSSKEERSTSGLILFEDEEDLAEGGNYVPGPPKDQISYRGELAGILLGLVVVNVFCKHHNIHHGSIELGCDNISALDAAFRTESALCTDSNYDIIRLIHYEMSRSPIKWIKRHVPSHQDKKKPYSSLDNWGKANVRADKKAKFYMDHHPRTIPPYYNLDAGWIATLDGEEMVSEVSRKLYEFCTSTALKEFWTEKNYCELDDVEEGVDIFNWEAIRKMSSMIPSHKRRWITKHMAHVSATGKTMGPNRRKKRDTELCPMCDEVEDSDHIIQCRCQLTKDTFDKQAEELDTWLSKHSPHDLRQAIMEIIQAVRERRDPIIDPSWGVEVQEATRRQTEISSRAFVHGLFIKDWMKIQTVHRERTRSKMLPMSWNAHLIRYIWDISWAIWRKRCEYLHSKEDARQKILAANIDNDITNLIRDMPPNTYMTKAQRSLLTSNNLNTILSWKAKRKIRWYKKASIMKESYEIHLANIRNHPSARLLRRYATRGYIENNQEIMGDPDPAPTDNPNTRNRHRPRVTRQRRLRRRCRRYTPPPPRNLPSLTHLRNTRQTTLPFLQINQIPPNDDNSSLHSTHSISSLDTDTDNTNLAQSSSEDLSIAEWQRGRIRNT